MELKLTSATALRVTKPLSPRGKDLSTKERKTTEENRADLERWQQKRKQQRARYQKVSIRSR